MDNHKIARILLVEDNQMDVVLTLDAFREAHLANKIQVVASGEQAISHLFGEGAYADRKTYPLPDEILLDLKLPGISGRDVPARLKATPTLKRIPAIILTASGEEYDLERCYDRDANSYLVKPVTFEEFLRAVHSLQDYWLSLNVSLSK